MKTIDNTIFWNRTKQIKNAISKKGIYRQSFHIDKPLSTFFHIRFDFHPFVPFIHYRKRFVCSNWYNNHNYVIIADKLRSSGQDGLSSKETDGYWCATVSAVPEGHLQLLPFWRKVCQAKAFFRNSPTNFRMCAMSGSPVPAGRPRPVAASNRLKANPHRKHNRPAKDPSDQFGIIAGREPIILINILSREHTRRHFRSFLSDFIPLVSDNAANPPIAPKFMAFLLVLFVVHLSFLRHWTRNWRRYLKTRNRY